MQKQGGGAIVGGNDTIDRYPPDCRAPAQILCVKIGVFEEIQQEFQTFLRNNKPPRKAKPKKVKPKAKTHNKKVILVRNSMYEAGIGTEGLKETHHHQIGRIKDWYRLYGQGMYE
jgi:hypothetical protein